MLFVYVLLGVHGFRLVMYEKKIAGGLYEKKIAGGHFVRIRLGRALA
jgi:hypothetical protein